MVYNTVDIDIRRHALWSRMKSLYFLLLPLVGYGAAYYLGGNIEYWARWFFGIAAVLELFAIWYYIFRLPPLLDERVRFEYEVRCATGPIIAVFSLPHNPYFEVADALRRERFGVRIYNNEPDDNTYLEISDQRISDRRLRLRFEDLNGRETGISFVRIEVPQSGTMRYGRPRHALNS